MIPEAANPRFGPRVAPSGPLPQTIQRCRYGTVRLLPGKTANKVDDLGAGTPSSLPSAIAGNAQAGVIAPAPVQQKFDATLGQGGDDLFEDRAQDPLAGLRRCAWMLPNRLEFATEGNQPVLFLAR